MRRMGSGGIDTAPDYFDYFFAAIWLRRRSPRSLSSGVRLAPKSSASKTGRISTSAPGPKGLRLSHSTASSMLRTCQSQKPATSSLVSAKGPSVIVGLAPVKVMRLPLELGWRPSPASITPALTSSSLNLPMLVRSSVLGRTPASDSLLALTNTMQRIVVSPFSFCWSRVSVVDPCSLLRRRTWTDMIDMVWEFFCGLYFSHAWVRVGWAGVGNLCGTEGTLDASP